MSKIELHNCDCLEFMKTMPDKSVDCVVTDPPYGIGENNKKNLSRGGFCTPKWKRAKAKDYGEFNWDSEAANQEQINHCLRISKNQIVFGGNFFNLPPSPCWIVWDKLNGKSDFADCELAWTSYKTSVRKFSYLWAGFLKKNPEERYHPTQKPLSLMVWILENYTSPGDTVFDPFFGSGTTGVACVQTGRDFIGCEIDPGYFSIAQKRIHDAQQQPTLLP